MDIIQIDNLNKSFGEIKAVQNLSFSVKQGELFAFGRRGRPRQFGRDFAYGKRRRIQGSVLDQRVRRPLFPQERPREYERGIFHQNLPCAAL